MDIPKLDIMNHFKKLEEAIENDNAANIEFESNYINVVLSTEVGLNLPTIMEIFKTYGIVINEESFIDKTAVSIFSKEGCDSYYANGEYEYDIKLRKEGGPYAKITQ